MKFFLLLLLVTPTLYAQELQEFKTDFCTMFPDGTKTKADAWKHCCFDHDLRFWFGGSRAQRDLADIRLRSCVEKSGHDIIARAMYYGVRVGRYSPIKNKYKWGWGWIPFKSYTNLDRQQKDLVKARIREMDLDQKYVEEFFKFYNL